jgi:hypothetical protein
MDYILARLIFSLDFPLRYEEMNYSCETVINVRLLNVRAVYFILRGNANLDISITCTKVSSAVHIFNSNRKEPYGK